MNRRYSVVAATCLVLALGSVTWAEDLSDALSPAELAATSAAVDKGLQWLSARQHADGSFGGTLVGGDRGPVLLPTSYAVMAFLSRGHEPGRGRYGQQVEKAVDFVLSAQRADGYFAPRPEARFSQGAHRHTHFLCSLALSEVYGFTRGDRAERTEQAVERAIAYAHQTQHTRASAFGGGWGFTATDGEERFARSDTTSRALIFLRSAHNAGFAVPQDSVDRGLEFIRRCYQPGPASQANISANGGFAVKPHQGAFRLQPQEPGIPPERWGNQWNVMRTGSGMLALQLHGQRADPMIDRCARFLVDNPVPPQGSLNNCYFYYQCYVATQAIAQVGGKQWENYYPRVVRRLLPHQDRDGHWRLDVPSLAFGIGIEKLGPEYNTALAVLCLTIPDQLLPIHQR